MSSASEESKEPRQVLQTITIPKGTLLYNGAIVSCADKEIRPVSTWYSYNPFNSLMYCGKDSCLSLYRVTADIPAMILGFNDEIPERRENHTYIRWHKSGIPVHHGLLEPGMPHSMGTIGLAKTVCAIMDPPGPFNGWQIRGNQEQVMLCNPEGKLELLAHWPVDTVYFDEWADLSQPASICLPIPNGTPDMSGLELLNHLLTEYSWISLPWLKESDFPYRKDAGSRFQIQWRRQYDRIVKIQSRVRARRVRRPKPAPVQTTFLKRGMYVFHCKGTSWYTWNPFQCFQTVMEQVQSVGDSKELDHAVNLFRLLKDSSVVVDRQGHFHIDPAVLHKVAQWHVSPDTGRVTQGLSNARNQFLPLADLGKGTSEQSTIDLLHQVPNSVLPVFPSPPPDTDIKYRQWLQDAIQTKQAWFDSLVKIQARFRGKLVRKPPVVWEQLEQVITDLSRFRL